MVSSKRSPREESLYINWCNHDCSQHCSLTQQIILIFQQLNISNLKKIEDNFQYFERQFKMYKQTNRDFNNNEKRSSKRSHRKVDRLGNFKANDYNYLLPIEIETACYMDASITSAPETSALNAIEKEPISSESNVQEADIISIISQMSETIRFLSEKVYTLSEEIRTIQNSSVLKINNDDVNKDEEPLFERFQTFELPIKDNKRLDELEFDLKSDQSFKIFFVRAII